MIVEPQRQIAEASPVALWCAFGWLVGRAVILLDDSRWQSWGVAKLTDNHELRFEHLVRLEAHIAHACRRAKVAPPKLAQFFGGSFGH